VSSSPGSPAALWETIAEEAARESTLWAQALLPEGARQAEPVFSALAAERYGLGLESIYEGYLLHYGHARLFGPPDRDTAILLGDYLYAHGLVRIAALGEIDVVAALAGLISHCAHLRAEGMDGDGEAWAATAASLADEEPDPDAVTRALALHSALVH
jgi:hypothetical protein